MPARYIMLIQTNADANHNKFYEVSMGDDGHVLARWGRVGAKGQSGSKGQGERAFDAAVRAKTSTGYKKVEIAVTEAGSNKPQSSLAELAKRDVLGAQSNPALEALIERLVALNRHQLLAASGGQIQIVDGQIKTPLGLITLHSVNEARHLLDELQQQVARQKTGSRYTEVLNEYLMKVPQRIPARRGWDQDFFSEFTSFTRQNDLLDQLEGSIKLAEKAPPPKVAEAAALPPMFGYHLAVCEDKKVFAKIEKFYKSSINGMHVSSRLSLKRIFVLDNAAAEQAFNDKVQAMDARGKPGSNVQQYWHGTRAHNVLSIFKGGLIIPRQGGSIAITGRMFGDGLYFSDQSSKSLNYAYGYWDHQGYDNNCYMFLCDVAMGKHYTPRSPGNGDRRKDGYDSCFAKANTSAVRNNEMIVYDTAQARLRYLCEFDL